MSLHSSSSSTTSHPIQQKLTDASQDPVIGVPPPSTILPSNSVPVNFIFSELRRQLPSLEGYETYALSHHLNEQLQGVWKQNQVSMTFRRMKIVENISRASITLLDFHCVTQLPLSSALPLGYGSSIQPSTQTYNPITGTVVMSEVQDPTHPEMQPRCIWSHVENRLDVGTFMVERDYLISALPGHRATRTQKVYKSIAVLALKRIFKCLHSWTPDFVSPEAAIQRACAWRIVSSAWDMFEYRLFAASLAWLFETFHNSADHPSRNGIICSSDDNQNDLIYVLTPFVRIFDTDIGKR